MEDQVKVNMHEEIFDHNLYGIHIKKKNDALSDENPHVCIGWSDLGDLSNIKDKSTLEKVFDENYKNKTPRSRGQQIGQIWRFINDIKIGDYIIFADGNVFHIGKIESEYFYSKENKNQHAGYVNNRKVKWIKNDLSRSILSTQFTRSLGSSMSVFSINDYKSAVFDLINGTYKKDDDDDYLELVYKIDFKTNYDSYDRNRIIFGAPGTGKSFYLKNQAHGLLGEAEDSIERVTFHPDYTYSQFVGSYKPTMDGDDIRYEFVPGPFMRVYINALKSARSDNPKPHLLIIEEINRARVAGVFGDIFQLLDRDSDGVSEYEIHASEDVRKYLANELGGKSTDYSSIKIPNNMFILATMNSADQGVFPLDTAFKRRWSFEYLGIDDGEDKLPKESKFKIAETIIDWKKLRKAINLKMSSSDFNINEDKLIGPFFLSPKLIETDEDGFIIKQEKFIEVFKSKVLMYLYEDAVKQRRNQFFSNCESSRYSSVCKAFDDVGLNIFGDNFLNDYYNK